MRWVHCIGERDDVRRVKRRQVERSGAAGRRRAPEDQDLVHFVHRRGRGAHLKRMRHHARRILARIFGPSIQAAPMHKGPLPTIATFCWNLYRCPLTAVKPISSSQGNAGY
jgi:hypothetical protein